MPASTTYYRQFPYTANAPPYPSTSLEPAIKGLITPGLVPDIARQSAEVAAGRGVAGSPAGASTAVRMSEQDYLKRLALANELLSGEAGRTLPYQITPYQSNELGLKWQKLQNERDIAKARYRPTMSGGGGGGYAGAVGSSGSPWASPIIEAVHGTRPYDPGIGGGVMSGGYGGSQTYPETLDESYDWLGFGNFGSLSGDTTTDYGQYPEAPDFNYAMFD